MSHVYDNWERLVAAVLKRQQYLKFCRSDSLSSSFNSVSSDFSSSFSSRLSFDLPAEQLPGLTPLDSYVQHFSPSRFSNSTSHLGLNSAPKPPKASAGSRINKIAGAARQFVTPAILRPQRKLPPSLLTGVPNLRRSELEAACEDFSNVLISSSMCTLYKGTLSSGVEIVVQPTELYAKNWSNIRQAQFMKEIQKLSKVSHKNFVNIIGYCTLENPFTRMVVFEYASNGVLFEYLHIKEAERLDWGKRLRIVMGIAYCLESMHGMTPPLAVRNLNSSNVFITEDYAAKLSNFFYLDGLLADVVEQNLQSNVYSFGVILLEMITGQLPYTTGDSLKRVQNIRDRVDPTLETYEKDQVDEISALIIHCVNPDPRKRPSMTEACSRLRSITAIGPDGAVPIYGEPVAMENHSWIKDYDTYVSKNFD